MKKAILAVLMAGLMLMTLFSAVSASTIVNPNCDRIRGEDGPPVSLTIDVTKIIKGWMIEVKLIHEGEEGDDWIEIVKDGVGDLGFEIYNDETGSLVFHSYDPYGGGPFTELGIGPGGSYRTVTIWEKCNDDGEKIKDGHYIIYGCAGPLWYKGIRYDDKITTDPVTISVTVKTHPDSSGSSNSQQSSRNQQLINLKSSLPKLLQSLFRCPTDVSDTQTSTKTTTSIFSALRNLMICKREIPRL